MTINKLNINKITSTNIMCPLINTLTHWHWWSSYLNFLLVFHNSFNHLTFNFQWATSRPQKDLRGAPCLKSQMWRTWRRKVRGLVWTRTADLSFKLSQASRLISERSSDLSMFYNYIIFAKCIKEVEILIRGKNIKNNSLMAIDDMCLCSVCEVILC